MRDLMSLSTYSGFCLPCCDCHYSSTCWFVFSERELMFMFAICRRRPSVVCPLSSVSFVHPTQTIEIFGNVSMPFGTLAICDASIKILRRSSQGNPSVGGLNQRGVEKCSDFGPIQGYMSETVKDRR